LAYDYVDSSADLDLATLSLNGRLTLSLDGADLTDSSDSVAPGLDMNYLVPLGSTNGKLNMLLAGLDRSSVILATIFYLFN